MRRLLPVFLIMTAMPATAEVTHRIEGRFGVAYQSTPDGGGTTQPLYEGRYTSTFSHTADNGLTFRFELGIVVGNIPDRGERAARDSYSVGLGAAD
ncbi:hypothetical protein [Pararhodobacter zhoushanensis]|uniref:Uncharacterized protein n=1 Tax=Pararhodobacter zhoushanensis TaxID=2479545 RepID=A0ABT3GTM3_9RHOB|nr:hypothetical protein [Pararhodobacter zhoushanensis]MCW1930886.1 hypothetical protein [Pararhodobacter zhoushanensis]